MSWWILSRDFYEVLLLIHKFIGTLTRPYLTVEYKWVVIENYVRSIHTWYQDHDTCDEKKFCRRHVKTIYYCDKNPSLRLNGQKCKDDFQMNVQQTSIRHQNWKSANGCLGRATRQPKWFATQICQYQAFLDWNGNVILTDVIVVATRDVAICCHLNEMFGHWLHWKLQKWQPASGISHDENFAKTTFPFQYETVLYITL